MGPRGLDSLWRKRADVAKIAHVCEMYFEWGVEKTIIKRFRNFLWPGAVLRNLLQIALERDKRYRSGVSTPSKRSGEESVETPTKALARTLRRMELDVESSDDDESKLIIAIRGERRHASTDETLEYRLEIDPRELVARAKSGIQGLRTELEDSAAAGTFDDDEDEDEDEKKKRGLKAPAPDPDSKLRVWMPAVMVQYACPRLTTSYMERKTVKEEKKGAKSKKGKKVRQEGDEGDESTPVKPVKPVKPKMTKNNSKKAAKAKVSYGSENSSDDSALIEVKTGNAKKATAIPVKPILATSISNSPSSQCKFTTQIVDENPFLASSIMSIQRNLEPKTKQAIRPQLEIEKSPSSSKASLIPRPFPLDIEDVFTVPRQPQSPTSMPSRKYSFSSASSADLEFALKKSPRKSIKQTSPRKPSLGASPSPQRPLFAPKMRPLHRAAARVTASKPDDGVIIISSDSDDAQPNTKASSKALHNNSRKALVSTNLIFESDVIDLT